MTIQTGAKHTLSLDEFLTPLTVDAGGEETCVAIWAKRGGLDVLVAEATCFGFAKQIMETVNTYPTLLAERDATLVAVEEAKKALEAIGSECLNFGNSPRQSIKEITIIASNALAALRAAEQGKDKPNVR